MQPYYLHVREDGTECRFSAKPASQPTMRVEREGGYEFTWTDCITTDADPSTPAQPVPPRGDGWAIWVEEGARVRWRRPNKRLPQ